ncbi:MAG: glycosyltransferase family 4 protein [Candidatus Promineifilaceae bacterium]|nr:glycosyltransferase family 4 protein [Candidatus Promineifilaceae bacterium]
MPDRWDGGLANYLHKVCRMLAERGHSPIVFVLSGQYKNWQDGPVEIQEVKRVDLPSWIKLVGLRSLLAQYLNTRRLAKSVWRSHRSKQLDILQASSYMAPGYSLLRNGRVPVVCRVSSYSPLLRSAYGRQRNFAEYLSDWMEIRQILDADASFAPSKFVSNILSRVEGYRPEVVRTPVELSDTSVDESFYLANLKNRAYLLFFGTLSPIKGVDLLAPVINEILQRHTDLSFVFIGRDDGLPDGQKMMDFLRENCSSFEQRIHYWPALVKAQLYPVIAKALGVIMPSRVDNYPNSCLEAQSLGVPVIGTDHSSLEEMIVDGKTGFLAKNSDSAFLIVAIERLLSLTVEQRQHMRQNLINEIEAVTAEDRVGQLIGFYEAVISDRRVGN